MRKIFLTVLFLITLLVTGLITSTSDVEAAYVNGYYKSNGTYVNGYYRSRSNAYTYDNYSYESPTYTNGYGYNSSFYSPYRSYSSNWYEPSYFDSDYSTGYSYYRGY